MYRMSQESAKIGHRMKMKGQDMNVQEDVNKYRGLNK